MPTTHRRPGTAGSHPESIDSAIPVGSTDASGPAAELLGRADQPSECAGHGAQSLGPSPDGCNESNGTPAWTRRRRTDTNANGVATFQIVGLITSRTGQRSLRSVPERSSAASATGRSERDSFSLYGSRTRAAASGSQHADLVRRSAGDRSDRQIPKLQRPEADRAASSTTRWPTCSHMRLTWRLRPSWIVISSVSDLTRLTRAGAVMPSSSVDAAAQRAQRLLAHWRAANHRAVGLVDLKARVGQPVRQVAVVGQQDQPRGVGVEPPDRVQALR